VVAHFSYTPVFIGFGLMPVLSVGILIFVCSRSLEKEKA
jgi:hypothetical protein